MNTLQQDWIEGEMARFQVPGISLGVLKGGKWKDLYYLGDADRELGKPVNRETLYEAASLTKPVFAWYVLGLVRQGFLMEDTLLSGQLPDYPIRKVPGADQITVMHTLTHSAGLENWGEKPLGLLYEPGQRFGYSGEGYTYLQTYVEDRKQKKLDKLFAEEVFPRVHMSSSVLRYCDTPVGKVAMCYDREGRAQRDRYQVRELEKEPNAAYSLYTSLEDYCNFLGALWEDRELLEKMAEPRIPVSDPAGKLYWGAGAGVWLGGRKMLWHYGDNGNFKNLFFLETEAGDGMVYFSNSYHGLKTGFSIARRLFGEDYGEMEAFAERWE